MTAIFLVIIGFAGLIAGAEALVRGASGLARSLRLSPLLIGLTVVAYGTSTPELAVSLHAGLTGSSDIALGNVVGSNIFNVLFILGLSSMVQPLRISTQLVRMDLPVMVIVSGFLWLAAIDNRISRPEGLFFVAVILSYTLFLFRKGQQAINDSPGEASHDGWQPRSRSAAGISILLGLALLVAGSQWLVDGSVSLARALGVSELIIALTIVAVGTSLPELATSVIASLRGEREIAVGNVVGSNIFNILAVVGLSGLLAPDGLAVSPLALQFDIPVMSAVALLCVPVFLTGREVSRWEGLLFVGYYIAYLTYLILQSLHDPRLTIFTTVMLWAILPATLVSLAGTIWRRRRMLSR